MNSTNDLNSKTISIQELFGLLKKYVLVILLAGLIGGAITFCVCKFLVAPVYEASAKMIVNSKQEQTGSVTNDQLTSAQKLVNTYAIIICSQPVLDPVVEELDLPISFEQLAKKVSVTSVNGTQVMKIAVQSTDRNQALRIVEEIVRICPDIIIEAVEAGSVKTIEPAHLQSAPVAPHTNLYTVLAAFLSMLAVIAVVLIRFMTDNTYKSEIDLRNDLDLPVLGVIPDYTFCLKLRAEGKEGVYHG